ncbi:carboxypeptidase-like regulatory domain-containing protein [Psychroserpens ponticola]|uniref:Carboxypeptidase-like regulatory domain-containing protein n=1 Tax=Psychroserpens ponticola TaxID=2932268 RepID=A0ABY7RWI0_9FLAO|nr:carboxypeptidase-like regulatory domain-containing protein [Psychroserpens ponticola]WCO01055.1 carboxypeptidase-like regulatory domain-containing protein [Psychroserpens ponticola]
MKKLLPILLFCISFCAMSQDVKRVIVEGKIIVEGNDIEGITVYNTSSNKGAVTDENGEFTLPVTLNDFIEIRALQYQNFDFKVSQAILDSKRIRVILIEEINKLDEVLVMTKGLSGVLDTDIKSVKTFNPKLDALYFGIKKSDEYEFTDDNRTEINNIAMHSQSQTMVNGLNIRNVVGQLLLPLFRSKVKDKKAAGIAEVPVSTIKYYFGSSFLVDNFNIPEHRVEEFIRYVEDDESFDFTLLNIGKELEFLEVLSLKSQSFLNKKNDKD